MGIPGAFCMCTASRIRTCDTRLRRPLLYPLSYCGKHPEIKSAALLGPLPEGLQRSKRGLRTGDERMTGIEPALSAWKADVLPLDHTRMRWDRWPLTT